MLRNRKCRPILILLRCLLRCLYSVEVSICWMYPRVIGCVDFFTARRSYASAVLRVVILSVRPSVCLSHACFVTKLNNVLRIF